MDAENSVQVANLPLRGGGTIPQVGLGTYQVPVDSAQAVVEQALALGYRHIDTAAAYYNEAGVGAALAASGLHRRHIFLAGKLRNVDQGRDTVRPALEDSLRRLGVDYLDMYMIHWPVPSKAAYVQTFNAFQELRDEGLVRHIGVCNFLPEHLERLQAEAGELPVVNQIEVHPCFSQPEVQRANARMGILTEAYSPLGQGRDLSYPLIASLACARGITPAELILAWHIRAGRVVIPKSVNPQRMAANLEAASVQMSDEEALAIDSLHTVHGRFGGDPRAFNYPQTVTDKPQRSYAQ